MAFVLFAIASIGWAITLLLWAITRTRRAVTPMWILSAVVLVAGAMSLAGDVRSIAGVIRAPDADVRIRIIKRPTWWQLEYARGGVAFTTADELHIPTRERVALTWVGIKVPSSESLIVEAAPVVRRIEKLRVVADDRDAFDRWFANEAKAAAPPQAQGFVFRNAGCSYCHVVRGIANEAYRVAPDLTHFASRAKIATTDYPNNKGMLSGWVAHSRGLDRRSEMPGNPLAPADLHAVVAFLETLH
ncbi:MAG TPA: c-type cytochrome [Thermoanaerobaculia bacterium]|nr:c-type cytochrome [Thermoanaerobaculia bacterium]